MFSERLIDDVERKKERPAYKYFKRAAKPLKGEEAASFERRKEHGAPKDKKWHDKNFLIFLRADFAQIQNEILAKSGYSIRVDSRSLDAQQAEAKKNGDTFLAKLYLRVPEEYIGVKRSHFNCPFAQTLQKTRQKNSQRLEDLFQIDLNQVLTKELETKNLVAQALLVAKNSPSFFASSITKLNALKHKLITTQKAIESAQAQYLSHDELKTLQAFKDFSAQIFHWDSLLKEMKTPPEHQLKNLAAFNQISTAIQLKISDLQQSANYLFPAVQAIEEKLKQPRTRQNITLVAHHLFQLNSKILEEMRQTSEYILQLSRTLECNDEPIIPDSFSLADVKAKLRLQYRSLKAQLHLSEEKLIELRKKVITPSRALLIAKNSFLNGNLKKLNAEKCKFEKANKKLQADLESFHHQTFSFNNTTWQNPAEKFQRQYYLTKSKFDLDRRIQNLNHWKESLDNESSRLDFISSSDVAKQNIAVIAAGILRKNLTHATAFEKEKLRLKSFKQNLSLCKNRLDQIANFSPKKNYFYRVSTAKTFEDQDKIVATIADAILGEPHAVQLVARSTTNNLEMDKDWELMSELDKDEFIHKEIFRDL